ncbi:hypothetical protein [Syntrophorhabdus aromaticivorans]|uniref:hypothetical protein n=1 Tax=Syntrophorhabdus aromaticivorans TaxID=328301 RepID=UPI0004136E69|nr:hypothetical protein [Syntrophorhabdus aromaticivorans]
MKSAWGVDRVWPLYLITGQKKNISVYPCSYLRVSAVKSRRARRAGKEAEAKAETKGAFNTDEHG